MPLKFAKMHGLGNDFMVIDAVRQSVELNGTWIRELADRRFGVGFDQLLLVERARDPRFDFRYRIFNADGAEVEHCGNGARCFALFVRREGLCYKAIIDVETCVGPIQLRVEDDEQVTVQMGVPVFDPDLIPFYASECADVYNLEVEGSALQVSALALGNPHAVTIVSDVGLSPVETLGPLVESHPLFPNRVNAGFMEIVDRAHIRLRVYERGVGETLACGTGACAAAISGIVRGLLQSPVRVDLPGGPLVVSWGGRGDGVYLTGPGAFVFEGTIDQ